MGRIRKVFVAMFVMMGALVSIFVGAINIYAAGEPGAVIGGGGDMHGGNNGPGGGGCDSRYNYPCAGVTWIFYKVNESEAARFDSNGWSKTINFPNVVNQTDSIDIDGACASHPDGGFWHYGINANGIAFSKGSRYVFE